MSTATCLNCNTNPAHANSAVAGMCIKCGRIIKVGAPAGMIPTDIKVECIKGSRSIGIDKYRKMTIVAAWSLGADYSHQARVLLLDTWSGKVYSLYARFLKTTEHTDFNLSNCRGETVKIARL